MTRDEMIEELKQGIMDKYTAGQEVDYDDVRALVDELEGEDENEDEEDESE